MHYSLLLCLSLILVVSLLVMLGQRLRISYPIFLVLGGLAISFIPGIPSIEIDPELIFLIFLPPLLYEAAWFIAWKDFWKWRRVIITFAFGLVLLTSCMVAFVSVAIIPGFTLSLGFLLGAIISPPDAVAATSVLKGLRIPKPYQYILEGESLVNDASSLTIYRFAVAAIMTGSFTFHEAALGFVLVTILGIVVGLAVGLIVYAMYRWLPTTPNIDVAISFVAPYIMYLTAEAFHVSGVMAVVSGGLFVAYHSHKLLSHTSRLQGLSMWETVTFILNGLVFMLIGLELPVVINGLGDYSRTEAIIYALVISAVIIIVRILTGLGTSLFTRFISRYIRTNDSNPGWRGPLFLGWAGMRGVVSLASALSVPLLLENGEAFPHRNLILFITFIVILVTLVLQGLTLPWVIRILRIEELNKAKPEDEQEAEIRLHLLNASLKHIDHNYATDLKSHELIRNFREQLENDILITTHDLDPNYCNHKEKEAIERYQAIYLDVLNIKRQALMELRDQDGIDSELIRKLEGQLDLEQEKRIREYA